MPTAADDNVHICGSQGWPYRQIVQSLAMLNLTGGDVLSGLALPLRKVFQPDIFDW